MKLAVVAYVFGLSLTVLIGVLLTASPTAVALIPPETAQPELVAEDSPSDLTAEISEAEEASLALQAIDELAAHPDDAQNPPGVAGLTDDEVSALGADEVSDLLALCEDAARASPLRAHYLFALGRIAYLHGETEVAQRLLHEASEAGSAAALAHYALLAEDPAETNKLLLEAAEAGFAPAADWLDEDAHLMAETSAENGSEPTPFDYSDFKSPKAIRCLHQGNFAELKRYRLEYLLYAMSLVEGFSDDQMLFLLSPEDATKFRQLQTPGLSDTIAMQVGSDASVVEDASKAGLQALGGMFKAVADTRRNGGSVYDEIAAVNRAGGSAVAAREVVKGDGLHDAKSLIRRIGTNFADVERVIHHVEDFCLDRPPRHAAKAQFITGPYDPAADYDRGIRARQTQE